MRNESEFVVVVLLNYNQNEYTCKCIESILLSNYTNFKILLVDNGSSIENFQELKSQLPVDSRLCLKRLEKNIGYVKGTNYGMEEAYEIGADYFLIMNNDTILDKLAIAALVATSKKYDDKARVCGKVFHYDQPEILQFIALKQIKKGIGNSGFEFFGMDEKDLGQFDKIEELDMVDDVFVLQPRSLYAEIGGYSTYFWLNGVNIDISMRAKSKGYKLIFCPEAKLWHKGSVSIGGREMNPKLAYWDIQGKLLLRYLYFDKKDFIFAYLKVWYSVIRTLIKSIYLKLVNGKDITTYAKAKLLAIFYFHRWLRLKNENDGYNPF